MYLLLFEHSSDMHKFYLNGLRPFMQAIICFTEEEVFTMDMYGCIILTDSYKK